MARPLGLSLEAAASGILDIVNNNMVGAIRLVSVERGHDPRELCPGAVRRRRSAARRRAGRAPRHAHRRGAAAPGVLSTFGLLGTEVRNDYARTHLVKPPDYDLAAVADVYADLEREARGVARCGRRAAAASAAGTGWPTCVTVTRASRSRCRGESAISRWMALIRRFHERHRQLYTYALPDAPVEIVTLRVAAAGRVRRFGLPALGRRAARRAARAGHRRVYFAGRRWVNCPIVDRETLGAGAVLTGPAIVEQLDSTTVVLPGQRARVDASGT